MARERKKRNGLLSKVGLGLVVLATLVGCGSNKNNEMVYHKNLGIYAHKNYQIANATDANKELINSDYSSLPMVESQEKYVFPGANKTIHFIGQIHNDPLKKYGAEISPLRKYQVVTSQNNIYYLLDYLITEKGLENLFAEGQINNSPNDNARAYQFDQIKTLTNIYLSDKDNLNNNFFKSDVKNASELEEELNHFEVRDFLDKLDSAYFNDDAHLWDLYKQMVHQDVGENAEIRLACEGRLNLLPAEDPEIHKISGGLLKNIYLGKKILEDPIYLSYQSPGFTDSLIASLYEADSLFDDYALNKREEALLEILSKDSSVNQYVLYGAKHQLLDNIEEWNEKHPNSKFSLDEIVISDEKYFPSKKEEPKLLNFSNKKK